MKKTGTSSTATSTATARVRSKKTSSDSHVYTKDEENFINSEGGKPPFRKKLIQLCHDRGLHLVVLEPGVFDHGVKRFGKKKDGYVVVYDYDKTAEALAKDYMKTNSDKKSYSMDDAYTDAIDWLDFNTIRSLPYMGEYAPRMVFTNDEGDEESI